MHRQMKILVMEPDAGDRERLVEILTGHSEPGQLVLFATADLDEALDLFDERHPDLILLSTVDVDRIGREICFKVRETEGNRHTGIIFIDSRAADDSTMSVQCLEMGADDFLRKGCTPPELMARVKAVLRLKAMTDELRSANHRLRILSMTDELTGLANMRSFNQRYGEVLRKCRKGHASIAVMMLDLDHFKSVNDTTNHLVGSYVIGEAGRILRQGGIFTESDVAARYGGDEFIVAYEAESAEIARDKAESIRRSIGVHEFKKDGCAIRITSSIGVAWAATGFDGRADDIIKAADLMLYRSKNAGRNRVSCMVLKYPVDLENVSRTHLVEEDGEVVEVVGGAAGTKAR
jgi:diguanylate cyclase (GGDEF)-like protein